jgi:hypothetical protein
MKGGIKYRFTKVEDRNPSLTAYQCFVKAIGYKRFSRKQISLSFSEFVCPDDYEVADKRKLIDNLVLLTNMPNDGEIDPILAQEEGPIGWVW